ncbi:hypothetical protein [uncultured Roseibium sp.]|uniref:hypothetical protein n=1 Tax=uncultured Roseibium sp. TaxID=1936171 RepID=UPI002594EDE3|nr:hypothetical protein [uncultured Roseibium sp.]
MSAATRTPNAPTPPFSPEGAGGGENDLEPAELLAAEGLDVDAEEACGLEGSVAGFAAVAPGAVFAPAPVAEEAVLDVLVLEERALLDGGTDEGFGGVVLLLAEVVEAVGVVGLDVLAAVESGVFDPTFSGFRSIVTGRFPAPLLVAEVADVGFADVEELPGPVPELEDVPLGFLPEVSLSDAIC